VHHGFSITLLLVAATALVSIAAFADRRLFAALLFEPFVVHARSQHHRFVTHAFVHANWPHLLVNMLVLYSFGTNVEALLPLVTGGPATGVFLLLYFGAAVFAALPGYQRHRHDPTYRAVGASGAVSAVLFAQVILMPTTKVAFLFIPHPIPAWVFGGLYLAYSWYMDKRGADNVAHDAHFYGAWYGLLFMVVLDPQLALDPGGFQRSLGR
jgi:membrane associated rhomboid family serine protease